MTVHSVPDAEPAAPAALSDRDLESLLLVRQFELALLDLFGSGEVAGTTHTCLGQEYIPVAVAPLLPNDYVFSNHRGHGHYLAHCGDPEGLLAEILGRTGAVCAGVGGSQHLHQERFLSTGVQGESVSVAVGVALQLKREGQGRLAAVYIGDGTWGQGGVYEALNLAQLWRVPLLVIVEHNGIAQSTPTPRQLAGSIAGRVRGFGIDFLEFDSVDIIAIRRRLGAAIERVRATCQPVVVQFNTIRLGPHSKGDDTRSEHELRTLAERDWRAVYAAAMPERVAAVEDRQRAFVADLVARVRARTPSTWDG